MESLIWLSTIFMGVVVYLSYKITSLEKTIKQKDNKIKELEFNFHSTLGELNRLEKIFNNLDIEISEVRS